MKGGSGRLRPNMEPNLECLLHWKNAGGWLEADLVVLETGLKCGIYIEGISGPWREGDENFQGCQSLQILVFTESNGHTEKDLWV